MIPCISWEPYLLPEYKRRILTKNLKIKHFSQASVSSKDLKKKILNHPDLEEEVFKMIGTKDE